MDPKVTWTVREKWSFERAGEILALEKFHEAQLRMLGSHDERRWDRCRVKWMSKHGQDQLTWILVGGTPFQGVMTQCVEPEPQGAAESTLQNRS